MADEADEWEALLPPLPDPSLPPGSWYIDALGKHRLNCNDVWVPKVGIRPGRIESGRIDVATMMLTPSPRLTFCCPQCQHEFEVSLTMVDAHPTLTVERIVPE